MWQPLLAPCLCIKQDRLHVISTWQPSNVGEGGLAVHWADLYRVLNRGRGDQIVFLVTGWHVATRRDLYLGRGMVSK